MCSWLVGDVFRDEKQRLAKQGNNKYESRENVPSVVGVGFCSLVKNYKTDH